MDNNIDPLLETIFFPSLDDDDELSKSVYSDSAVNRASDNISNPVADFVKAIAYEQLAKSGASWDWDEPISPAPRIELSAAFLKRSNARLQRFAEKVRSMFPEHQEETDEMIDLARAALTKAREAVGA